MLSSFVTPHIHRSILISATSNFFPVPSSTHKCLPGTSVSVLPLSCTPSHWYSCSCRTTLHTLFQFFHPLCNLCLIAASNTPSSANVDRMWMHSLYLLYLTVNGYIDFLDMIKTSVWEWTVMFNTCIMCKIVLASISSHKQRHIYCF